MGLIFRHADLRDIRRQPPKQNQPKLHRFPFTPNPSIPVRVAILGGKGLAEEKLFFEIARHMVSVLAPKGCCFVCFPNKPSKKIFVSPRDAGLEKEVEARRLSSRPMTLPLKLAREFTHIYYLFVEEGVLYVYDPAATADLVGGTR